MRLPATHARVLVLALAAGALLLGGRADAEGRAPRRWAYRVEVAPDLSELRVTVDFERFEPRRFWVADGGPPDAVAVLPESGIRCAPDPAAPQALLATGSTSPRLAYRVDLRALERRGGLQRAGQSVLTQACAWLVRPAAAPDGVEVTVAFDLPEGMAAHAPWPRRADGRSYLLPRRAWDFVGHVALGALRVDRFEAAGARVDAVRLDGSLHASDDGLRAWLAGAVEAASSPYGGAFPGEALSFYLLPVAETTEAVPFGSAWYGGDPHVVLLVGARAADAALRDDWTAVHEALHATMPPFAQDDAWFSEGVATYYQEVVRARAGLRSREDAWSDLESGFRRGRADGRGLPLERVSREMRRLRSYLRVYWSGAAIALLMDADLRRSPGAAGSLDEVLRWLHEAPGARERALRALDALAFADRRLGAPRLAPLAQGWLSRPEFPDLAPLQAWLGIAPGADGRVALVDGAPGAEVRDAILAPSPAAASAARGEAPGAGTGAAGAVEAVAPRPAEAP